MVRRGLLAALVAAAVSACGVGADGQGDVQRITSEINKTDIVNPPSRDCRWVGARPTASGTIRAAPAAGMLEVAPVGSAVQSMYFENTMVGGETRHGVAEFDVPVTSGRVLKAQLRFTDVHGWTLQSMPADLHRLSIVGASDGVITTDDFVREGTQLTTFATDLNDMTPPEHVFDVTTSVELGGRFAAHIQLDRAPSIGSFGSGFDLFQLDVLVCNEGALQDGQPTREPGGLR